MRCWIHGQWLNIPDGLCCEAKDAGFDLKEQSVVDKICGRIQFCSDSVFNLCAFVRTLRDSIRFAKIQDAWGGIIRYNADGVELGRFQDVEEIAMMFYTHKAGYVYKLASDTSDINPTRLGTVNFKTKILEPFDQKSYKTGLLTWLNMSIRMLHMRETVWNKDQIMQQYRWLAFDFCLYMVGSEPKPWLQRSYPKLSRDSDEKLRALQAVLNRWPAFEQIDDLNEVKAFCGLYLLVMDGLSEYGGVYVGISKSGVRQRIRQHFSAPKSAFDRIFGFSDVTSIYAMGCLELIAAEIETDIICTLTPKVAYNCLLMDGIPVSVDTAEDMGVDLAKCCVSDKRLKQLQEACRSPYSFEKIR